VNGCSRGRAGAACLPEFEAACHLYIAARPDLPPACLPACLPALPFFLRVWCSVKAMEVDEKPTEDYGDIGGLDKQIQELREAIVLPITHRDRFVKLGIKPPKGVLLHGPPGGWVGAGWVGGWVGGWLQGGNDWGV
jgi:hypothetical protein